MAGRWANTRAERMIVWALRLKSPTIAMWRKSGRPTLREAWRGVTPDTAEPGTYVAEGERFARALGDYLADVRNITP